MHNSHFYGVALLSVLAGSVRSDVVRIRDDTESITFSVLPPPTVTVAAATAAYGHYSQKCGPYLDAVAYSALAGYIETGDPSDATINDPDFEHYLNNNVGDWGPAETQCSVAFSVRGCNSFCHGHEQQRLQHVQRQRQRLALVVHHVEIRVGSRAFRELVLPGPQQQQRNVQYRNFGRLGPRFHRIEGRRCRNGTPGVDVFDHPWSCGHRPWIVSSANVDARRERCHQFQFYRAESGDTCKFTWVTWKAWGFESLPCFTKTRKRDEGSSSSSARNYRVEVIDAMQMDGHESHSAGTV
ncbi:hypothetical protein B0H16DRAFT_1451300 [Mycena metata]|uniref:Uncharacterized protein n=1 Tax=Mycena metata TaxID=1033252 RepID=A0AAD7NRI1_9AGAR|nr:hypothetical protein B0H16DRAFT_1451300 [Mycena metata]